MWNARNSSRYEFVKCAIRSIHTHANTFQCKHSYFKRIKQTNHLLSLPILGLVNQAKYWILFSAIIKETLSFHSFQNNNNNNNEKQHKQLNQKLERLYPLLSEHDTKKTHNCCVSSRLEWDLLTSSKNT